MKRGTRNPAFELFEIATAEALDHLSRPRPADMHVHAARKAIKRARAALRLLRPSLDPDVFDQENRTLRDATACLSPLRDAKARFEATTLLDGRHHDLETIEAALVILRQALKVRLGEARKRLAKLDARGQCATLIEQSRARLEEAPPATDEASNVGALKRMYRKARKTFAIAKEVATPANLHEWRKHCKYLHLAAVTLRSAGMDHVGGVIKGTRQIAGWLGDDHDLVELTTAVLQTPMNDHESAALLVVIGSLRGELERNALLCGEKVFRKSPKRFAARLA